MVNTIRPRAGHDPGNENDNVVPVTRRSLALHRFTLVVKIAETDGYNAVQIGFGDISEKHVNKPMAGHFAARVTREVRVEGCFWS